MNKKSSFKEQTYTGVKSGMEFNLANIEQKEKICQRIEEIRKANKLKQQAFCDKINVNIFTYRGYAKGRTEPPAAVLLRIAEAFELSLDYIYCRTDNPQGLYNGTESRSKEKQIQDIRYQIEELQSKLNALKNQ